MLLAFERFTLQLLVIMKFCLGTNNNATCFWKVHSTVTSHYAILSRAYAHCIYYCGCFLRYHLWHSEKFATEECWFESHVSYKKQLLPCNRPWRFRVGVQVRLYSFFSLGARRGWVVNATFRPLYPRKWTGTRSTGGWMGSTAGLNGCGKSRLLWDSIPRLSLPLYWLSYSGPPCFMYSTYGAICRIWGDLSDVAGNKNSFFGDIRLFWLVNSYGLSGKAVRLTCQNARKFKLWSVFTPIWNV